MINIVNVSKSFGERRILNDVSIDIEEGSVLTLVGPSGGGKTTLLRCISGLEKMDSGKLVINDKEVSFEDNRGQVGVVFQDFNLFSHLTVMDNLILAPNLVKKLTKEKATQSALELLDKFGLSEHQQHYPSQLSGGQKQRIAIARALLMKPDILCYDEPTSALDPGLVDSIAQMIIDLKQENVTQVVVTHDMGFAEKIADQLIKIEPVK